MVSFFLSFLILLSSYTNSEESFEGRIELVHQSLYDTSYFTYFVKKEHIRIDRFDQNHTLKLSLLMNLDKGELFILSPDKKMYTPIELIKENNQDSENFTIQKTENSRIYNGYEVYQWRVRNIDRNTEVAYWVSQDNYYFFNKMVELLNKTDNTYEFFEKIPDTQGFFPMLSVERTLLRHEKSRTFVIDISKNPVDETLFEIPKDYELIRR